MIKLFLGQSKAALRAEIADLERRLADSERARLERDEKQTSDLIAVKRDFNAVKRRWQARRRWLIQMASKFRASAREHESSAAANILAAKRSVAAMRSAVDHTIESKDAQHANVVKHLSDQIRSNYETIDELMLQRDLAENNVKIVDSEIAALRDDAAAFAARIALNAE